jgi:predicted nuclease of predicted toxin-antitoxin system
MKFLVDAQLPPLLATVLNEKGFDAIHTQELPEENDTSDEELLQFCDAESRVLISKDSDFYHAKVLRNQPEKLLLVRVGNMRTRNLLDLFRRITNDLQAAFEAGSLIELYEAGLVILY